MKQLVNIIAQSAYRPSEWKTRKIMNIEEMHPLGEWGIQTFAFVLER